MVTSGNTDSSQQLLKKTQLELDQIYSTTESIMSTNSFRDSQHLFIASTEPILRNSVMISVDSAENRLSSSAESSNAEKEESSRLSSNQNPYFETSR